MNKQRIDLQYFAEETVADLASYLGVTTGGAETPPAAPAEPAIPEVIPPASEVPPATPPAETPPAPDTKPNVDPTAEEKRAYAFEQMRLENKKKEQVLSGLQKLLNIPEGTAIDEVVAKVQEAVVKAQSKQQGIPEDILQKINTLEQRDREFAEYQLKEATLLGFNKIQKDFNLPKESIEAFARELQMAGLNPFAEKVDIVTEYRNRHFDDIVAAKMQEAIRVEQERSLKAGTQSSKPNNTQGQTKGEPTQINSVKELDNWLEANKK